jgi:hypothetical protein
MRDERCFRLLQALNFLDLRGNVFSVSPNGSLKLRVSTRSDKLLPIGKIVQGSSGQIVYVKKIQPEVKYLYRSRNAWSVGHFLLSQFLDYEVLIRYLAAQGKIYELFAAEVRSLGEYIEWPGQEPMWVVPIHLWRLRQA